MRHCKLSRAFPALAITALFAGHMRTAMAEEPTVAAEEPTKPEILSPLHTPEILSKVTIIGDPDAIYAIPGSAHYIDYETLKEFSYDDINRVLRRIPGVYVREEDGYGLFPNISLRGVDTSRSAKVTMMEDGILSAPAPYASPSSYYSPTVGRMHALEILMGTSQIRYGPRTTGGAINYISTPIPDDERISLRAQYGAFNEYRTHAIYGNTVDTQAGRFGYLFEAYIRETDGFKTIDAAPGFTDTDRTGFTNIEPMVKLSWEPMTSMYQRFEFRYGFTDRVIDETYLGLNTADFRIDPNRRYSATRFDQMVTEQHRVYLRHFISPIENFDLVTTLYYNKFSRDWFKSGSIRDVGGAGNLSLSAAVAGAASAGGFPGDGLACLKGDLACDLRYRHNNRDMFAWGIQSEGTLRFDTGSLNHELTVGLRYHNDEEDRFQQDDDFKQNATGAITGVTLGKPGSQADREIEVKAVAVFIQDRIEIDDWWLIPGFRYETLDMEERNFGKDFFGETSLDMFGGGIGIGYDFTDEWQAFGGVHFGFSPPSPQGAIKGLTEETSIGYELGVRFADRDQVLTAEVVGFLTHFDNLIVIDNIGGTGTGDDENFGEVESSGVELSGQFDLGLANDWAFNNPYFLAYTYTNAVQESDARSTSASSIFSFGRKGNKVPYIPEHQLTVGSSLVFGNWGASITASYVDATFTSANNVSTQTNGFGAPDARFGETDAYTFVDFAAHYNVRKDVQLIAGVSNLFDEEYIVSRQPHGPRPGAPRIWFAGLQIEL